MCIICTIRYVQYVNYVQYVQNVHYALYVQYVQSPRDATLGQQLKHACFTRKTHVLMIYYITKHIHLVYGYCCLQP